MSDDRHYAPQVPMAVGLARRCPRCGQGRLFGGMLKMAPGCSACGLAYEEPGDGAAIFVILIGNFLILGAALWVEFTFEPPLWVHVALWVPLSLAFCILASRLIKGVLMALQYANQTAEGRLDR